MCVPLIRGVCYSTPREPSDEFYRALKYVTCHDVTWRIRWPIGIGLMIELSRTSVPHVIGLFERGLRRPKPLQLVQNEATARNRNRHEVSQKRTRYERSDSFQCRSTRAGIPTWRIIRPDGYDMLCNKYKARV